MWYQLNVNSEGTQEQVRQCRTNGDYGNANEVMVLRNYDTWTLQLYLACPCHVIGAESIHVRYPHFAMDMTV